MTALEYLIYALSMCMGVICAFLLGCIVSLRRRIKVLENYINSLENSLYL